MISGFIQITPTDARKVSTTKNGMLLGSLAATRDGKLYRWSQAGASNLAAGKLNNGVARIANHTNLALTSVSNIAVNSQVISVTLGGTAVTADQYVDATAVINDGTGVGQSLLISGNQVQATTSGAADIYLAEGVITALAIADTKVTLQPNPQAASIVTASSVAVLANGVANTAVPAGSYYWSQVYGEAPVLSDGVIAKGAAAIVSDAVNGAAETAAAASVSQTVGVAPDATVDTKYQALFLTIQ